MIGECREGQVKKGKAFSLADLYIFTRKLSLPGVEALPLNSIDRVTADIIRISSNYLKEQ